MFVSAQRDFQERFDPALAVEVCRLFFIEEKSKLEIAKDLGMSRFKVARLISAAKAKGLVRIDIANLENYDASLSGSLVEALSLDDALVIRGRGGIETIARPAARYISSHLRSGDVLGLGWGSTVRAVVNALALEGPPKPVSVVQLVGGVPRLESASNAIQLAGDAANILGGRLYPLHAPAIVESAATRDALLREGPVADTVRMFARVTVALVGIGSFTAPHSSALYRTGAIDAARMRELEAQGACGDVFGHVFDAEGRILERFSATVIGISAIAARHIRLKVAVAAGAEKADAISAAARVGLANVLITDQQAAETILNRRSPNPMH